MYVDGTAMIHCTAAVARGPGLPFSIERLTIEPPRADEVLIKVAGAGLCHTDLVFRDQVPYPFPAVLGHEGAGTIVAVGADVSGLIPGDKVIIGFSSCGGCSRCDEGLPSYCRDFVSLNYAGRRLEDGSVAYTNRDEPVSSHFFGQSTFASLAVARARNIVKVETDADLAILGALACGMQTGAGAIMRTFACPSGSSLVIFGGGPVGLAAVMASRIRGCGVVVVVEPIPARRELALELGATHVVDPGDTDIASAIRTIVPHGVDFAFDTTGIVSVIEAGLASLGSHGALGLVGVPRHADAAISVNITKLMTPGHRIVGIIEGDSDQQSFIPELLAYHASGQFPFERLVRTWPLEDINSAVSAQARGDCVKAILIP